MKYNLTEDEKIKILSQHKLLSEQLSVGGKTKTIGSYQWGITPVKGELLQLGTSAPTDGMNKYVLRMYNYVDQQMFSINFEGNENILNQLHEVLLNQCKSPKETNVFTLGSIQLEVKAVKALGTCTIFISSNNFKSQLTDKHLNNLFNK